MELLDVIKFEPSSNSDWLAYKPTSKEFISGSKLVVGPGQRAICVHLGKIEGEFKPGVTVLHTENYPFLKGLINKAHNGKELFDFEIYFINTTVKSKREWGTKKPVLVQDPDTGLLVHARGHGSYNFRLVNAQFLLQMLLGTFSDCEEISFSRIQSEFDDKVQETLQYAMGDLIINQHTSVLEVSLKTIDYSMKCSELLKEYFAKYGFELIDFNTSALSVLDEDVEAYKKKKEYDVLQTSHIVERQLDISKTWAENEGTAGGLAAAGMGLGIGLNAFNTMTNQGQTNNKPANESGNTIVCAKCNAVIPSHSRFCLQCGTPIVLKCKKCGEELPKGSRFCPICGEKVGE